MKTFQKNSVARLRLAMLLAALHSMPAYSIDTRMQMDGAGFSKACTRADESWISFCNGYVQAVIDSVRDSDRICLPNGTTRTEIVTIAEKEITASKQLQKINAHDAVLSVLRRFYKCR
jgi:hypothetical protein